MSKGLKALKSLYNTMPLVFLESNANTQYYIDIEKDLKDYEETKQDLKQVMKDYQDLGNSCYKKLKALEIIKKKHLLEGLVNSIQKSKNYDDYIVKYITDITKEEYDLLKEVLL